ncbi:hypothetical protein HanIR_Chr15g0784891 [Helianthus annuus]|nr:hypothetical protein HanIR_Chr15g0784891 [Helianthus annuus]
MCLLFKKITYTYRIIFKSPAPSKSRALCGGPPRTPSKRPMRVPNTPTHQNWGLLTKIFR